MSLYIGYNKITPIIVGESGGHDKEIIEETLSGEYSNSNITKVGAYKLANNQNLTKLDLPNCTEVGTSGIANCYSLVELNMPNVTSLGSDSLNGCRQLSGTYNFQNLTNLGSYAFRYAGSNSTEDLILNFPAIIYADLHYVFSDCKIKEIKFLNCERLSGISSFEFSDITYLHLPKCSRIEDYVFGFSDNSYTINLYIGNYLDSVCELTNSFSKIATNIWVSPKLLNGYKTATNWTVFKNNIKPCFEPDEILALSEYKEQPTLTENGTLGGSTFAVYTELTIRDNNQLYKAFDKNYNTYFRTEWGVENSYITMYNPLPLNVTDISITNIDDWDMASNGGSVLGSDDNTTWTNITDYTNSEQDRNRKWNIDLSSNTNSYKYYKITINNTSRGELGIAEIDLTVSNPEDYYKAPIYVTGKQTIITLPLNITASGTDTYTGEIYDITNPITYVDNLTSADFGVNPSTTEYRNVNAVFTLNGVSCTIPIIQKPYANSEFELVGYNYEANPVNSVSKGSVSDYYPYTYEHGQIELSGYEEFYVYINSMDAEFITLDENLQRIREYRTGWEPGRTVTTDEGWIVSFDENDYVEINGIIRHYKLTISNLNNAVCRFETGYQMLIPVEQ